MMNSKIQNILNKIEKNGFEAYIVGGYVRDHLLGIESTDVDICTNALPKDIVNIFKIKTDSPTYGSIKIVSERYNFDITTYRKESHYNNRKPEQIEYINNLLEDIKRRDFTINSMCMNSNGNLIDLLNGQDDLKSKMIRVIGDPTKKLTEDPLRILRAIRFATVLDFSLDQKIEEVIINNPNLVKTLSYNRKKEELDKILISKNAIKGLNLLKKLNLLSELELKYDRIVYVPDLLGMWAQIEFSPKYPNSKYNLKTITTIRKIVKDGIISKQVLFENELYVVLVAGEILGFTKEEISKAYANLPIHSVKDLAINYLDVIKIMHLEPSNEIKKYLDLLVTKVINNELKNEKQELEDYLIKIRK